MNRIFIAIVIFVAGCSEGPPKAGPGSSGAESPRGEGVMPELPDPSSDEPPRISSKDIEDGLIEIPAKEVPFVDAPRATDPISGLKGKIGQEVILVGKCSSVLPKNAGFLVETGDQGAMVISMNGPWPSSVRDKFESMGGNIDLGAEVRGILRRSIRNDDHFYFEKPTVVRFWAVGPRAH